MDEKKRKYAKFLLTGCLNLKDDDKLFIIASDMISDFVDIIKNEAKSIGVNKIETLISHPYLEKELYLNKSYEEIINSPLVDKTIYNKMAKEGYAFLNLSSPLPEFFKDVNSELLAQVSCYQMHSIEEYREYQNKGLIKWNIAAVPNEMWVKSLNNVGNLNELWELILEICLINSDDPILAWQQKMGILVKRAEYLNNLHIDKLVYKNSLGTNLEIGLPKSYVFASAEMTNLVNMPTEEVFTSPDRLRINGIVYSSKPLYHEGKIIEDFWLEFKDGKVIDFDAKKGKRTLKGILDTDEGSCYLGEVALVDDNSPISKTNILFKNTLFDENASCHLALGASFPECVLAGLNKSMEELKELGLNYSHEHVDFFIGTDDLEIKAILQNGKEIVIMDKGNFIEGEIL